MGAYGVAIFCDDIRFEQQNKISLIGCYGPDLIVSGPLPVVLPKLCVMISVRTSAERYPAIKIFALMPGQSDPVVILQQEEEKDEFRSSLTPEVLEKNQVEPLRAIIIPWAISPFFVEKEGFIRIRMDYGAE